MKFWTKKMATFSRNHFFLLVAVRGSEPAPGSFYANPKLSVKLSFVRIFVLISKRRDSRHSKRQNYYDS